MHLKDIMGGAVFLGAAVSMPTLAAAFDLTRQLPEFVAPFHHCTNNGDGGVLLIRNDDAMSVVDVGNQWAISQGNKICYNVSDPSQYAPFYQASASRGLISQLAK